MTNKRVFSIIGCEHGHIGVFIADLLKMGYECAGIYERRNTSLRDKLAAQYNIRVVHNKEDLLVGPIHIVGSSAINNEKIDIIEFCEQHGMHIMVDKPAVTDRNGYERLEAVVNRGKIQVGMLLTERFRPVFHTLKNNIENGVLGDIVSIGMRKPHKLRPETRPDWHFSKEQNGGLVIDLFVHDFDLLRWLTGQEIVSCAGTAAKNILPAYTDFYDVAHLHVQMDGNTMAQLYCDWHTPRAHPVYGDGRVFVVGTKAYAELRLGGDPLVGTEEMMIQVSHEEEAVKVALEEVPVTISEDFVRRIHRDPSVITHLDILRTSEASIKADENVKWASRF